MPTEPRAPHAHSTCPFARRHGQCTRLRTAQVTWHAGMTAVDQLAHLACHSLLSFWNLLSTQESSAASHKCHFRVRHFGRVFDLPFKNTLGESLHLVHCCISALREKGSAGFEPRPSSSSTSFSARMIPRRSRCHLLLMPSSLPPLPRCSCAVLPHRHRAAPTFPSPLPSDAAALDVAVAAAVAQAVATAVGRHCRRRCHHPRSPYVLFVWCAGDLMRSHPHGGREQLELLV